jgi:DTW domain-containing protein YfiP
MSIINPENELTPREYCYICCKPGAVCVCSRIPDVDSKTGIVILQHPLEKKHPLGTARIAALGLSNCSLKIAYPDGEGLLKVELDNLKKPALLYPSAGAVDLAEIDEADKPETLIVIDGTWSTAKRVYKDNAWLHRLPHYSLTPSQPSRYRIRAEPDAKYVSTVEAIVEALKILEPDNKEPEQLIGAFESMIDDQIRYIKQSKNGARHKRPSRRRPRTVPAVLSDEFENVVVVYAENIRLPDNSRLLLSLTAKRMVSGETFEMFVKQDKKFFNDDVFKHNGIKDVYSGQAVEPEIFIGRWFGFLRPDDVLCPWNKGALQSLFAMLLPEQKNEHRFLFLKAAYGNTVKEKFGTLDEVVRHKMFELESTGFTGRAETRMASAIAVAKYLNNFEKRQTASVMVK